MRTKSMILGAALLAAGVASSMAQSNVYSLNVVGYVVQATNAGGSALLITIANQLNTGNDVLSNVIQSPPNFTSFYLWDTNTSSFDTSTFVFGSWSANLGFTQGQGAFVGIPAGTTFSNTFVGQVQQGLLTNKLNSGLTMTSSQVPLAGTADSLGLTAAISGTSFPAVLKWNVANQSYDNYSYVFGSWGGPGGSTNSPAINVGESFFTSLSGAASWVTNFTVQ